MFGWMFVSSRRPDAAIRVFLCTARRPFRRGYAKLTTYGRKVGTIVPTLKERGSDTKFSEQLVVQKPMQQEEAYYGRSQSYAGPSDLRDK